MKSIVQKIVTVLAVYKFKNVARICFTVLSSNGVDKYHTCFQGNGRESCDCPSTSKKGCYHLNGLRPRAQAYFESQKALEVQPKENSTTVAILVPEGIAIIDKSELTPYDILATQPTEAERAEALSISQHLQAELVLHQAEAYAREIEAQRLADERRVAYVNMYDPCMVA